LYCKYIASVWIKPSNLRTCIGKVILLELELELDPDSDPVIGTYPGEILFAIACRSSILNFSAANEV
jgi:hypothetical protein